MNQEASPDFSFKKALLRRKALKPCRIYGGAGNESERRSNNFRRSSHEPLVSLHDVRLDPEPVGHLHRRSASA